MKQWTYLALLSCGLGLGLSLSGCASHSPNAPTVNAIAALPQGNARLFSPHKVALNIPEPADFYRLADADKANFLAFAANPDIAPLPRYEQLTQYIHQMMENFSYEGQNLSATAALKSRSGNCMTLAMVTYALAKAFNVRIAFRAQNSIPMLLDVEGSLAMYGTHVRSLLMDDLADPHRIGMNWIDYFPASNFSISGGEDVDETTFMAMFYRNLASDAMLANKLNLAYQLAMRGLSLAPQYAPLINFVGVLHRQAGDLRTAAAFYEYGLTLAPDDVDLLSNYQVIARLTHDDARVALLQQQIDAVSMSKPVEMYISAINAIQRGQFDIAEQRLKRFLKSYAYFHRAYFLLARCQEALGDRTGAEQSLVKARQLAGDKGQKQLYSAKLATLQLEDKAN